MRQRRVAGARQLACQSRIRDSGREVPTLSLKLFGGFELREDEESVPLPTRKTRALLAYLAVHASQPQAREKLAGLLWGDRGESQARHSLNQALLALRRVGLAAGVEWIESQSETVMLREEQIAIDVGRFGALIEDHPRSALDLYTGPLLEGMALREQAFDDWLVETRRRLHERACRGYEALAVRALEGGDLSASAAAARRLIELEPLREDAHRLLMRLQHAAGDRAGALQQYLRLRQQLDCELGVAPSAETQRLHQSLREGSRAPEPTAAAASAERQQLALPPVADRPSIAVMAFDNLSGDPQQEYFADGTRHAPLRLQRYVRALS